jgi:hypothetical protein
MQIRKAKDLSAPLRIQRVSEPYIEGAKGGRGVNLKRFKEDNKKPHEVQKNSVSTLRRLT